MPIKPDNITDAEWNAMDEVTRMRAANRELALAQACDKLIRNADDALAEIAEVAALLERIK